MKPSLSSFAPPAPFRGHPFRPFVSFVCFVVALLGFIAAPAQAQTAKSRSALYTEIDTNLPSTTGAITAAVLRAQLKNVVASAYNTVNADAQPIDADLTAIAAGSLARAATVYVETTGNDATGTVNRPEYPFATINAALDALPSTGGVIRLGIGAFAPITDDYDASSPGAINPASKLKDNVAIIGAARPVPNSGRTALERGTIIKGPLAIHRNGVGLFNLGIDSGSDVCTALYSGTAQEGLGFFNITGTTTLNTGTVVFNVVTLCQSATAAVHSAIFENQDGPQVSHLWAIYGTHGVVFKSVGGVASNILSEGHSTASVNIRSNPTTGSIARDLALSNVVMRSIATNDSRGLILDASAATSDLERITVNGLVAQGLTSFDLSVLGGGGATTITGININGFVSSNGFPVISASGTRDADKIIVNGLSLNNSLNLSATLLLYQNLKISNASIPTVEISSSGTSRQYASFYNSNVGTVGYAYVGRESATGGQILGGASANAMVVGLGGAYSLEFFTNNAKRFSIDSSGAATFAGSLTSSGDIAVSKASPVLRVAGTTNTQQSIDFYNSNVGSVGYAYVGRTVSGNQILSGSSAAAMVIGTGGAYPLEFFTNNAKRLTISSTGAATFSSSVSPSNSTVTWTAGSGTPESVVTAPVGSLYSRTDGGASTTLYVKQSGTGNTGWVAK